MSALPRVLQLRSSAGLYGADRMLLTLNGALGGVGVDSTLGLINNYRMPEQPLFDAAIERGQATVLLPCRRRVDLDAVAGLARLVRDRGISLLHVHDYKSAFYAWLATRRHPRPLVATLHGQVDSTRSLRFYNRIELALLRRFSALAVVSARQVDILRQAGIDGERIQLIDNAIEAPLQRPDAARALRESLGLPPGQRVFGAVARLSAEKNLAMLVEAFARLAEEDTACSLLLVGDGPEASALRQLVRTQALESRVHFLGLRKDMGAVYPLIDCLVLPSLSEGMPLVVLEAMALGIPVIASDVGEVPRLLAASEHGRVVARGDLPALVEAMRSASAGRFDAPARLHIERHHSPHGMATRYATLYRSLTEQQDDHQAA